MPAGFLDIGGKSALCFGVKITNGTGDVISTSGENLFEELRALSEIRGRVEVADLEKFRT